MDWTRRRLDCTGELDGTWNWTVKLDCMTIKHTWIWISTLSSLLDSDLANLDYSISVVRDKYRAHKEDDLSAVEPIALYICSRQQKCWKVRDLTMIQSVCCALKLISYYIKLRN